MSLPKFIINPDPKIYLSNNYVVIDLETTNKDKGDASNEDNDIVFGYCSSPVSGRKSFSSLEGLKEIETRLYEAAFVVAQNAKFELKWFKRAGIDISRILIYDTLIGEFVIAGNRKFSLDLDSISKRYGGEGKASLISKLIGYGVCPSDISYSLLRDYCKQDVRETERIFLAQRTKLADLGLLPVFFLRCITTPVLADIEMNGIHLDKQVVMDVYKETNADYSKVIAELNQITGGINMASPQQVATFLYTTLGFEELRDKRGSPIRGKPNKAFPDGQPLTDEATLLSLQCRTSVQKLFRTLKLDESRLRKKITAYIERMLYACGYEFSSLSGKNNKEYSIRFGSGLIHGSLNQTIAQTHRLTSSNPNLQNIDRTLKKCLSPRYHGWKIRSADYKTLEFTTAGILTGDPQIRQDIENNYDIHSYTAKTLTDAGQTTNRQGAKAHTFKPLYGGESGTKAEKAYYAAFRQKYHVCNSAQKDWVTTVLKTGQLKTVTGLVFYWPDTKVTSSGYITNTNKIFDYPVQMFATADLAPTGVCLTWHHVKAKGMKSLLINEVHDSCVWEEEPNEAEELGNLIERCMSKDVIEFMEKVINFKIDFPIRVEQKSCDHWDSNLGDKK